MEARLPRRLRENVARSDREDRCSDERTEPSRAARAAVVAERTVNFDLVEISGKGDQ